MSSNKVQECESRKLRHRIQELRKRLNEIEDEIDREFKPENQDYEPAIKSNN